MKSKKVNIKKILYIIFLSVLALLFIASLTFGAIGAFTTNAKEAIEEWILSKFNKDWALLKTSIIILSLSSIGLILTLSFADFKKKYID